MNLFSAPGEVVVVCIGYMLGCLSTGYYLVRLRTGQDLRTIASGSTGSTNVKRILGTTGFVATLLGDAVKAACVVWAADYLEVSSWGIAAAMTAVVAGHIWPVQLGFHGGKGLAPGLGVLAATDYRAALICGGIAVVGPLFGQGTATLLLAATAAPGVLALLHHGTAGLAGISAVVLLIWIAHQDNIRAFLAERRGRKGLQA